MISTRLRFALTLSAAPLLSGCVAALIPVAASGVLLGKDRGGSGGEDKSADAANRPAGEVVVENEAAKSSPPPETVPAELAVEASPITDTPVPKTALTDQTTNELPAQDSPATTELAAVDELSFTLPIPAKAPPPALSKPLESTPAPPAPLIAKPARTAKIERVPAPASTVASAQPVPTYGPMDFRAYDALYSYVDSQARRDPVQSARQSALLAAPGTLSPMRTDCSIRPPAILIDLDPGTIAFDPSTPARPNPALSQLLGSLRLQEVEVFWISELSAIKAGALRNALIQSGMDPAGRDQLLLMRRIEDRKQARRKELSETHCLLAIAGDVRSDFDELFLYLRDKSAAQPLEAMIGAGWFITPLPLSPPNPESTGAEGPNPEG